MKRVKNWKQPTQWHYILFKIDSLLYVQMAHITSVAKSVKKLLVNFCLINFIDIFIISSSLSGPPCLWVYKALIRCVFVLHISVALKSPRPFSSYLASTKTQNMWVLRLYYRSLHQRRAWLLIKSMDNGIYHNQPWTWTTARSWNFVTL